MFMYKSPTVIYTAFTSHPLTFILYYTLTPALCDVALTNPGALSTVVWLLGIFGG